VEDSLLKVDDFLNHRVEPPLMTAIGETLAAAFAEATPELVLTAEASGIPPGMTTAAALGIPFVYAKKYPRDDAVRPAYVRAVSSPTKGVTAEALGEIVLEAKSELVGLGFVVEKSFMEGRARLETHGWRVESVAIVTSLQDGMVSVLD